MARLPRLNLADIPQHVIQRGNNRQTTFFDDQDYTVYLDKLRQYSKKHNVLIHAFVLMSNHVHLLMTPTTKTGVSQLMQYLGRYYVQYINRKYNRSGTLWEGRYRSALVDEETYFLTVSRYIELNPVRANMVGQLKDYQWSSYQGNAMSKEIELLTPHSCYQVLGQDAKQRREAYTRLFKDQMAENTIDQIRLNSHNGWLLGDDQFMERIEKLTDRNLTPRPRGGDRKSRQYKEKQKTEKSS